MGGSSKSSTSSSNQTYQYDNRIGATDQAVVVGPQGSLSYSSVVNSIDPGLTDFAKAIGLDSIDKNSAIAQYALANADTLATQALSAIGSNADHAFEFVDQQRQSADEKSAAEIAAIFKWLIGGASVIAIVLSAKGK